MNGRSGKKDFLSMMAQSEKKQGCKTCFLFDVSQPSEEGQVRER